MAREIRITSSGKMKAYVAFALDSLQKDESQPVVLHTLPNPDAKGPTHASSATVMPRLVSVVEIIKREYIKTLELAHSPRLTGLHQYNEVGSLEALGLAPSPQDTAEDRAEELIRKLEGKNIKLVQTPYMKITLSLSELPELKAQGATYQLPLKRKLSKSAKARAKKREKTATESQPGNAMEI